MLPHERRRVLAFGTCLLLIALGPAEVTAQAPPLHLNATGPPGSGVDDLFQITPDGRYVVYAHDAKLKDAFVLYSVPIGGGSRIALSPQPSPSGEALPFRVDPSGARVVYLLGGLFSVPVTGPLTARVNLGATLPDPTEIFTFTLFPDGSRVLFATDYDGDGERDLWVVPIAGPASAASAITDSTIDLTPTLSTTFAASPASDEIVLIGADRHLYSIPVTGPPWAFNDLSPFGAAPDGGILTAITFTPDGSRIVYRWREPWATGSTHLYSVRTSGTARAVRLDGTASQDVGVVWVSPNGDWVVYETDTAAGERLFAVPTAGPSTESSALSDAGVSRVEVTADSSRVVYVQDGAIERLYSAPIDGLFKDRVEINGTLAAGRSVESFELDPRGRWVVYTSDEMFDEWVMGFRTPVNGPGSQSETLWIRPFSRFYFDVSATGAQVVVKGTSFPSGDPSPPIQLFSAPLYGPPYTTAIDLTPPSLDTGISSERLSPTGDYAVFLTDVDFWERGQLYSVKLPYVFLDGFESGNVSRWSATSF